jgi:hypothetical protein
MEPHEWIAALEKLSEAEQEQLLTDLLTHPLMKPTTYRVMQRLVERGGPLGGRATPIGGMGTAGEPISRR